MNAVSVEFESVVPATPDELWDWSTSVRGTAAEMRPLLVVDFPKGMTSIPQDQASMGRVLGNCKFLLFGLVPVDLSRLTFTEIEPGRRFVEQSKLVSMKRWRHERIITHGTDGTHVVDKLDFTPRLPGPIVKWFVSRFFAHRHTVLRRAFANAERRAAARAIVGAAVR